MSSSAAKLSSILRSLRACTTSDVADSLLQLKVPLGGFLPGLTMFSPGHLSSDCKVVAPVQTMQYELNAKRSELPQINSRYELMDHTRDGCVLVLNCPLGIAHANFGGNMALRAQKLGAVGAIVAGNFRDLPEMREMKWPLWARGQGIVQGKDASFPSQVDVPVTIESFVHGCTYTSTVKPNDIIIADVDGVVCIPSELAEKVASMAVVINETNEKIRAEIDGGAAAGPTAEKHFKNLPF